MSTIIYPSPIFGPIHSRRLGVSLGVNLQPADGKVCSFDCVYCECGFNADHRPHQPRPTRAEVAKALEATLTRMKAAGEHLDVITFAGNGEPTGHPDFAAIIDDTISLRDSHFPEAKVSVLTNSTFAHRPDVHDALMKVDNNIMKLDTIDIDYIRRVDRPVSPSYCVEDIVKTIASFHGHAIVQTMFMKGTTNGHDVDNTTDRFVTPWLDALRQIAPREVMIYTIDRETPDPNLLKATHEELNSIRDRVAAMGIECTTSY
jgi:wyosine [tRNA(Phe)-imidazoG37] synthetase (radical SAM superfamily)